MATLLATRENLLEECLRQSSVDAPSALLQKIQLDVVGGGGGGAAAPGPEPTAPKEKPKELAAEPQATDDHMSGPVNSMLQLMQTSRQRAFCPACVTALNRTMYLVSRALGCLCNQVPSFSSSSLRTQPTDTMR